MAKRKEMIKSMFRVDSRRSQVSGRPSILPKAPTQLGEQRSPDISGITPVRPPMNNRPSMLTQRSPSRTQYHGQTPLGQNVSPDALGVGGGENSTTDKSSTLPLRRGMPRRRY